MATSLMMSVPLTLMGESSQKAVVFDVELKRGQALSQVYMKPDIIVGLVFLTHKCQTFSGIDGGMRAMLLISKKMKILKELLPV